jgi:outer membrane lipoprotein-sorting protein
MLYGPRIALCFRRLCGTKVLQRKERITCRQKMHAIACVIVIMAAGSPALAQGTKPANGDAANQLFQKMEDRLADAKTLQCMLEIKSEGSGEPGFPVRKMEFVGSLALGEGNYVRLELTKTSAEAADLPGVPFWLHISDGRRELHQDSGMPKPQITDHVAGNLHADLVTLLARSGFYLPTLPLPPVEAADMKDRFPVSEFKLGPKEKVGEIVTQRLDYRFDVKGQKQPNGTDASFRASVWLDANTNLPVKRAITWKLVGVEVISITEHYKNLVVDERIDPKEFELPVK